jgi:hypothetical protein
LAVFLEEFAGMCWQVSGGVLALYKSLINKSLRFSTEAKLGAGEGFEPPTFRL